MSLFRVAPSCVVGRAYRGAFGSIGNLNSGAEGIRNPKSLQDGLIPSRTVRYSMRKDEG